MQASTEQLLTNYSKESPYVILVTGRNLNDGIGDFAHLYDVYNYLSDKYKNNNRIRIQCISLIDENKLALVNRILNTKFLLSTGTSLNNKKSEIRFFKDKDSIPISFLNKLQNPDLMISVSIVALLPRQIHPRMHCILGEYEIGTGFTYDPCDKMNGPVWVISKNMGISPDRAGIKIIKPILELRNELDNTETKNLKYENPQLNAVLSGDQNSSNFLGAGYLQSRVQAVGFILSCIAQAKDKTVINLCTNYESYSKEYNELFLSIELNELMKSFTDISIVSSSGDVLFHKEQAPQDQHQKTLRIIQFKNISERDKNLLFASADSVAASGDTSCSELITSKAFPYIGKKYRFINEIIEFIRATNPEYIELIDYFTSLESMAMVEKTCKEKDLGELIQEQEIWKKFENSFDSLAINSESMQQQWEKICTKIIESCDVTDYLDKIVSKSLHYNIREHHAVKYKDSLDQINKSNLTPDTLNSSSKKI